MMHAANNDSTPKKSAKRQKEDGLESLKRIQKSSAKLDKEIADLKEKARHARELSSDIKKYLAASARLDRKYERRERARTGK